MYESEARRRTATMHHNASMCDAHVRILRDKGVRRCPSEVRTVKSKKSGGGGGGGGIRGQ